MTYSRNLLLLLVLAAPPGCSRGKGQSYELEVTPPDAGRPGQVLKARVLVRPARGFKINREYPSKLQVSGPAAASPTSLELSAAQATRLDDEELLMEPGFSLPAPGEYTFSGKLKFSVCTEELCEFKELPVKWVARVEE
jgi:hypothetical protein